MTSQLEKEGTMFITLGAYLKQLESEEGRKPAPQRREVPTIKTLAEVVGVHYVTLTNISNDKVGLLNLEVARKVLDELWHRGFHPQLTDFLKYIPPEINHG
jgi:hypothetical protein